MSWFDDVNDLKDEAEELKQKIWYFIEQNPNTAKVEFAIKGAMNELLDQLDNYEKGNK